MRILGGILLVTGTAIGAGMLALPMLTVQAGFFPSSLLFFAVWLGTLFTALLVLEVNLWFKKDVNLITMAHFTLGKKAEVITWVLFLLLLYSLTAAYLVGSGSTLACAVGLHLPAALASFVEPLLMLLLFAYFVYKGTKQADMLNRVLMVGLVLSYIGLLGVLTPHSLTERLEWRDAKTLFAIIPVVLTSFGFHSIIPVLTSYLKQDVKALRLVIWVGSIIPLIVYLSWEYLALTAAPVDQMIASCEQGTLITASLSNLLQRPWITTFASLFSFFAIVTSFLGAALSLASFLQDGLKIKKRLGTVALTFLPPFLFLLFFPKGFVLALQYAGIIVALLSGILPALMVWKGRNMKREQVLYRVRGGKISLLLVILCSMLIILIVIMEKITWIKSVF